MVMHYMDLMVLAFGYMGFIAHMVYFRRALAGLVAHLQTFDPSPILVYPYAMIIVLILVRIVVL